VLGISGYAHVGITVSDIDRSADWYEELFGWVRARDLDCPAWRKIVFEDSPNKIVLSLTHHKDKSSNDQFTETRTGLDHLSFTVPSFRELEAWKDRLDERDIQNSGVNETKAGAVVVFRDPDNIQLEVFAGRDGVDDDYRPTDKWLFAFPPVRP